MNKKKEDLQEIKIYHPEVDLRGEVIRKEYVEPVVKRACFLEDAHTEAIEVLRKAHALLKTIRQERWASIDIEFRIDDIDEEITNILGKYPGGE
jgi:ADP-heptose:LPS heptosyltransferase